MTIEEFIVSRFKANATLKQIVGTKIRPIQAVLQSDRAPMIQYETGDEEEERYLDGSYSEYVVLEVTINVVAESTATISTLERAIRNELRAAEGYHQSESLVIAGVKKINREDVTPQVVTGDEKPVVVKAITYAIKYRELPV